MAAVSDELVPWLLDQIAEDERAARLTCADSNPDVNGTSTLEDESRFERLVISAGRILREAAAKRDVIARYRGALLAERKTADEAGQRGYIIAMSQAVQALAAVYGDRPGFRNEWRLP